MKESFRKLIHSAETRVRVRVRGPIVSVSPIVRCIIKCDPAKRYGTLLIVRYIVYRCISIFQCVTLTFKVYTYSIHAYLFTAMLFVYYGGKFNYVELLKTAAVAKYNYGWL